jgi:hypothetical protein
MENSLFPIAEKMIGQGLSVFPCYKNKKPRTKRGFYDSTTEIDQARAYFLNHTIGTGYIGIRTGAASGGIVVIDIDVGKDGDIRSASEIIEYITETYGTLPDTLTVNTPSGGRHLYYHSPQPLKTSSRFIPGDPIGIDCRAEGGYVIGPDEENYVTDGDFKISECTQIPEWIIKILSKTNETTSLPGIKYTGKIPLIPEMKIEIANALDHLDYDNRDVWIAQGFALKSMDSDDARRLWDEWSQKSEKYDSIDQDKKWNSFDPKNTTISSLFFDAKKSGYISEIKTITNIIEAQKEESGEMFERKFKWMTRDDVKRERPPISWIVENMVVSDSLSMITGDAGSGKTWASLDMAVSIARGEEWIGLKTIQGPVLIIDEESGDHRLSTRLKKILEGHNDSDENPTEIYYSSMCGADIKSDKDLLEIEKFILEKNIKFCVIDALMDVVLGADENSVMEMMPAFSSLRKLSERVSAAFWVIHHNDKAGKGYRGSSAIKGAVDSMMEIIKTPESDSFKLKSIKIRDGEPITIHAKMMFSDFSFNITKDEEVISKSAITKTEKLVLQYLIDNGNSLKTDIENYGHENKFSKKTITNSIYNLVKKVYIGRSDIGGSGEKAEYGIIEKKKILIEALLENGYIIGNIEEMNV